MSVHFLVGGEPGSDRERVALIDSTTGWAIGPTFDDCDEAQSFLDFVRDDVRLLTPEKLYEAYLQWLVHSTCALARHLESA